MLVHTIDLCQQIYLQRDAFQYGKWVEQYRATKQGHKVTVCCFVYVNERRGAYPWQLQCVDFPNASERFQTLELFAVSQQKRVQVAVARAYACLSACRTYMSSSPHTTTRFCRC